jgi:transposase
MRVKRAFKYRFKPTPAQAAELSRTFGCVRLVYNRALEARSTAWRDERRRVSYVESSTMLDRWVPSSKTCSVCGAVRDELPLNIREWRCGCGAVHDRDVNAARNILAAGLAATACGDGVRPAHV